MTFEKMNEISQKKIYEAVDMFWRENYCSPSLRDVEKMTGLSVTAIRHQFDKMDDLFVVSNAHRRIIPYWVRDAIREHKRA